MIVNKSEPEPEQAEAEPEPATEENKPEAEEFKGIDTGSSSSSSKLSNTQAMNSFNSLPESVKRMIMDADSEDDY